MYNKCEKYCRSEGLSQGVLRTFGGRREGDKFLPTRGLRRPEFSKTYLEEHWPVRPRELRFFTLISDVFPFIRTIPGFSFISVRFESFLSYAVANCDRMLIS